jgi:hypothetical protein
VLSDADFDELCRRLYRHLRDGTTDRAGAFDLACEVLVVEPLNEAAADLARLCTEEESDPGRIAELTRRVLADRYEPGFAEEPGWLAALEEALEIVKLDIRAGGVPGTGHLYVWEERNAFVEWDGYNSHAGGIHPFLGSGPLSALVAVADDAQDAVMHAIWTPWPVCPAHSLGTHAMEREGAAVWWCKGAGGHVAAPVGQWPAAKLPSCPGCGAEVLSLVT